MSAETRDTVSRYLAHAENALGLIPDLPGTADNATVAAARLIIHTAIEALHRGRSPEEIQKVLQSMGKAKRFDVDKIVAGWLADQ